MGIHSLRLLNLVNQPNGELATPPVQAHLAERDFRLLEHPKKHCDRLSRLLVIA